MKSIVSSFHLSCLHFIGTQEQWVEMLYDFNFTSSTYSIIKEKILLESFSHNHQCIAFWEKKVKNNQAVPVIVSD